MKNNDLIFKIVLAILAGFAIYCGLEAWKHIPEAQVNEADWLTMFISAVGLFVSAFGFYYVVASFNKDIQNRNLNYLGELDKILIEHPDLWAFYDSHRKTGNSRVTYTPDAIEIKDSNETCTITNGSGVNITFDSKISTLTVNGKDVTSPYSIGENTQTIIHVKGSAKISNISSAQINIQLFIDENLNLKLQGLCYYKLNHYEMFIRDKSLKEEWKGIAKYSLRHSTVFRELVKNILENRDTYHKGLYTEKSFKAFLDTYNEYASENKMAKLQ